MNGHLFEREVNDHEATKAKVVQPEILTGDFELILASDEREADAELDEKLTQVY